MRGIKHWFKLLKFRVRSTFVYPLDVILGISGTLLWHLPNFVLLQVTFDNINFDDEYKSFLVLLYGLSVFGDGIQHTFFEALWQFGNNYIKRAQFDQVLTRPCSNFVQVVTSRFDIDGLGGVIWGTICCAYSINMNGEWGILILFQLLLAMINSAIYFVSINILTSATAFFIYDNFFITQTIFEFHQFARYPKKIYSNIIRIVLTYFIPVLVATNYSAEFVGKNTLFYAFGVTAIGCVFFRCSIIVWNLCSRVYKSSGS